MTTENDLQARSGAACEICAATTDLAVYEVPPTSDGSADQAVLLCGTCRAQIGGEAEIGRTEGGIGPLRVALHCNFNTGIGVRNQVPLAPALAPTLARALPKP